MARRRPRSATLVPFSSRTGHRPHGGSGQLRRAANHRGHTTGTGAFRALLVTVLATTVLASSSPTWAAAPAPTAAPAPADVDSAPDNAAAVEAAQRLDRPIEILDERTERSSTWAHPDGLRTLSQFGGPVWVRRPEFPASSESGWAPVDLRLEAVAGGAVRPKAHPRDLLLSGGSPAAADLVRLGSGIGSVAFEWPAALPTPRLNGARAVYAEVMPEVDLVVEANRTGFEQFFVVKTRRAAERISAQGGLTLGLRTEGVEAVQRQEGHFDLVDADGRTVGSVPAPVMWDATVDAEREHPVASDRTITSGPAAGEPITYPVMPASDPDGLRSEGGNVGPGTEPEPAEPEYRPMPAPATASSPAAAATGKSRPVETRTEPRGEGRTNLTLRPDPSFLTDPTTQYPLIVDPGATVFTNFDLFVQSNVCCTDYSGDPDLKLGTYGKDANGNWIVARSFMQFDIYGLRSTRIVHSNLALWNYHSWSCNARNWQVYETGGVNSGTRWGSQPGFGPLIATSADTNGNTCPANWSRANITGGLQSAVDRSTGQWTLGIKAENETDVYAWKRFHSQQAANPPRLDVTYDRAPDTPQSLAVAPSETLNATLYSTSRTPSVTAVVSDPDGGSVHALFDLVGWPAKPSPTPVHNDTLTAGSVLSGGQTLSSGYGTYRLVMQTDGNAVVYTADDNRVLWNSGTGGNPGAWFAVQPDGNLVVYSSSSVPLWASGTSAASVRLVMQEDGNLVLYRPDNVAIWNTGGDPGRVVLSGVRGSTVPSGSRSSYQLSTALTEGASYLLDARASDGSVASPGVARLSFGVDTAAPTAASELRSTSHSSVLNSGDRTIDVSWTAGSDAGGVAGYSVAFTKDQNPATDSGVDSTATSATSGSLADGAWYAHVRTVDTAGRVSASEAVAGPYLVGEATLADALLPSSPVAHSNEIGLEQFNAYDDVPLGTGTSYVNLRTGNVATSYELVSVPGQGLNTVVRLTHNSQQAARDSGIGRGWSLSVTDLEAGLGGVLEDLSDGAVTDIDINRDVTLGQISNGSIVQNLAYTGAQVTGDVLEFVDGDGTTHRFVRNGGQGGQWLSPPGVDLKVREVLKNVTDPTGATVQVVDKYEFFRPDGVVYTASKHTFAGLAVPVWRISSVADRNGNQLSYTHANFDGVGVNKTRLTEIRHNRYPTQVVVRFTYQPYVTGGDNTDAGVLRSITSLPGVSVGGRSYERRTDLTITAGDHRLTGWTENAHTATLNGTPVSAAEQARRSVALAYNADFTLASASDGVAGTRLTRFGYTAGRPAGTPTTAPAVPRLNSVTDRAGSVWRYAYTTLTGNRTSTAVTRPVSSTEGSTSTYTLSARQPVSSTDTRVAGGNLVEAKDAGNNTGPVISSYRWAANKLAASFDGQGVETSFRYDSLGLLIETTSPATNRSDTTLPTGASTARPRSSLTYRTGASYPSCTDPADDGSDVTALRSCALFADLTRIVTAAGTEAQRVADFDPDPVTGQLRSVAERANVDGSASSADRTSAFGYYTRGALKTIDGPRTDVNDVTTYGDTADTAFGGYDRSGQPTKIVDASGKTKTFTYTPYGTVTSSTDRDGRVTTSRYDERDNLIAATVPGGAVTDYGYDGNDNKTTETQPARTLGGVTYRPVTSTVYDLLDRAVEVHAPGADERPGSSTGKTVTTTGYFADGTVAFTDGPLTGDVDRTTHTYWPNRQPKQTSAPAGTGQRALTDFEYDNVGRSSRTLHPAVNSAGNRPVNTVVYTPSGDVARTATTSPTGAAGNTDQSVSTFFTLHGEVLVTTGPRTVDGQGAREENSYDRFGQLTSARRLAGRTATGADKWIVSQTGYDQAGNTVRSTQATGDGAVLESLYRYDGLNRLAEQTKDPVNPNHQVRYGYNGEGQQTLRQDVRVDPVSGQVSDLRQVETAYNSDNTKRSEAVTTFDPATPDGQRTLSTCNYRPDSTTGYDSAGNLLYTRTVRGPTRAAGTDGCATGTLLREQTSSYDDRDWPTSVSTGLRTPAGATVSRSQRMTYHPNGSKASLTHNDGSRDYTVSYAISPAGWDEKITDWRGKDTTALYLPSGDISRHTLGATSTAPNGSAQASSDYHVDGSLKSLAWTGGGQTVRAHTAIDYDLGGIRSTEQVSLRQPGATSNTVGTAGYGYDLLDRLTSYTSPHPFDDTETRKPTTTYSLDDGGNITRELAAVADPDGSNQRTMLDQTSSYTAGRLTGRVSRQTVADLTSPLDVITTTDSFSYNELGEENLRSSTDSYAGTLPSPIADTTSKTVTSFDAAGHPLRSDNEATQPADTPQAEKDSANADVDYLYDSADRVLSRVQTKAGVVSTTLFFYAAGSGQLLEETDAAGKTKTRYLLDGEGEPVGQQTYTLNPDGSSAAPAGEKWTWLLNDALGNTATVVDDTGAVIEQKAFDPHGKPESGGSKTSTASGTPTTTVGFQSARTDEVTGRVMLGQRQYDPSTARFTTPDVYAAGMLDLQLGTDSLTGNRYLFAGANPMSFYEDGHGLFSRLKKIAKRAMPVLAYVPIVSAAIDVASAATGRNFYEGGRKMSGAERLTMLGGAALAAIPGVGLAAKIGFKQAVKASTKTKTSSVVLRALDPRVKKGDTTVYQGRAGAGPEAGLDYIGVTKHDIKQRFRQHARGDRSISKPRELVRYRLDRRDAEAVEQYLIHKRGLANLANRRNNVSPTRWLRYRATVFRGWYVFQRARAH